MAVGTSEPESFNTGDWAGIMGNGNGGIDAIIVKVDNEGNVVWKKNFGGNGADCFYSVTAVADDIVAAGCSFFDSFGNGNGTGVMGRGNHDAIIVKYGEAFVPVTNITDVPLTAIVNVPLILTGIVEPNNATNQTIVWNIKNAGNTGANLSGNIFNATAEGVEEITATIADGLAIGTDFTQDFTITINPLSITETAMDKILVYPNPTNGELRIESGKLQIEKIEISDAFGKKQNVGISNILSVEIKIDITHLPVGVYFVKIFTEVGEVVRKVLKE